MHTPEPWTAGCDRDDIDEANVILAGNVVIARVEDAPEIRRKHNKGRVEGPGCSAGADALDEVDDIARLMAAAPTLLRQRDELLRLLIELLPAVEAAASMSAETSDFNCLLPAMRKAIAEASAAR